MVTFLKISTKMVYYTNFDEAPKEFLKTIIDYDKIKSKKEVQT
jgi:hypothetical protein